LVAKNDFWRDFLTRLVTLRTTRFLLFAALTTIVIAWVSAGNDGYASLARAFLRQLFRQLF
jgi:hypothetical protein